jgi:hypothetical protein
MGEAERAPTPEELATIEHDPDIEAAELVDERWRS